MKTQIVVIETLVKKIIVDYEKKKGKMKSIDFSKTFLILLSFLFELQSMDIKIKKT